MRIATSRLRLGVLVLSLLDASACATNSNSATNSDASTQSGASLDGAQGGVSAIDSSTEAGRLNSLPDGSGTQESGVDASTPKTSIDSGVEAAVLSDAATTMDALADGSTCVALDSDYTGQDWVTGTLTGAATATVCPGSMALEVFAFPNASGVTAPSLLASDAWYTFAPTFQFHEPASAVLVNLSVLFDVSGYPLSSHTTTPLVDAGVTSTIDLHYVLADNPDVDCTPDSSASCPPGCVPLSLGCLDHCTPVQCYPRGTEMVFELGPYSLTDPGTLTIDTAELVDADAGTWSIHGSFSATLVSSDGGVETIDLTMAF